MSKEGKKSYNRQGIIKTQARKESLRQFASGLISDKEQEIKIASIVPNSNIPDALRDELIELRAKYAQFLPEEPPMEDVLPPLDVPPVSAVPPTEEDPFGQENDGDPIPASEAELNDVLFNAVADSFTTVLNEADEPVFDVRFADPETIVIEYSTEKGGFEKAPFIFQNLEQFMKPILLDIIDKIGFGEDDPEMKKQMLVDELKEPLEMYRDSLETQNTQSGTKEGKNTLIYKRSEQSLSTASQIYDILKRHGLAGPEADMDYSNREAPSDNTNMIGEPAMEAKKKSFNLKKHADKLYDTVREKAIQETDPQYKSRHGKHALPWYEDAYIPEVDFKEHVMDKYTPEQLDADGEYRGGYINDRFVVHHNTEGNSLHIKPGETSSPDRTESFSTERRLEEMRENDLRGYENSEGSKTEQQTHKVEASSKNLIISEEHGVYKVACGSKVTYLDTEVQLEAFKKIVHELLDDGYTVISDNSEESEDKKKISQVTDMITETPAIEEVGVAIPNTEAEGMSGDNPLLSLVTNLREQYPNASIETLIQQGIVQLSASGMNTATIEQFRVETMQSFGMPTETRNYDQIEMDDEDAKRDELAGLMGD